MVRVWQPGEWIRMRDLFEYLVEIGLDQAAVDWDLQCCSLPSIQLDRNSPVYHEPRIYRIYDPADCSTVTGVIIYTRDNATYYRWRAEERWIYRGS